ncbi:helix-turn-helix transcriptional regulator [Endozoicomonas montiporae]|nr:helix-turn-helix domain-containing protein [Endozoicomonas montiporae]
MTLFINRLARLLTSSNDVDIRIDEFLTRDEVCDRLKVTRETLRKRIRSGEFPEAVKVAGQERWPTSLINQHIYKTNHHLTASRDLRNEARAAIEEAMA